MALAGTVALWLCIGIGLCALVVAFLWSLDKALTAVLRATEMYSIVTEAIFRVVAERRKARDDGGRKDGANG